MNKNGVLCIVALSGLSLWCVVWYAPLLAAGAAIKAAGKVIRRA